MDKSVVKVRCCECKKFVDSTKMRTIYDGAIRLDLKGELTRAPNFYCGVCAKLLLGEEL